MITGADETLDADPLLRFLSRSHNQLTTEAKNFESVNLTEEEEDEDEEESVDEDIPPSDEDEENEEVPEWNSFKDSPPESESISMADNSLIDASIQILKLLSYVVTFGVVLLSAIFAKSIFLLMTSQLTPDRTVTVRSGSMYLGLKLPEVEKYLWIWALLITFSVPELGSLIRSIRVAIFKGYISKDERLSEDATEKFPFRYVLYVTVLMETLHVVGLALFVFEVLPQMDVVRGVMLTNSICVIPALLSALSNGTVLFPKKVKVGADIIALLLQLTGLFAWPAIFGMSKLRLWTIPISLLLTSCGWWMNYVSEESSLGFIEFLGKIKERLKKKNVLLYRMYIGISVWKILVFFGSTILILSLQGFDVIDFFRRTEETFSQRQMIAHQVEMMTLAYTSKTYPIQSIGSDIWWIIGAQVLSAYLCYVFGKFACRVMIQPFSFALPCALVVPAIVVLIVVTTGFRNEDPCAFCDILPEYVFFNSPQIYFIQEIFIDQYAWIWIFWLISQVWITFHIWMPRCERLSKTETLFATPMYSAFLVDQSVALNRRRDEVEIRKTDEKTPHIIACATMWHETRPEMLEMLKSLLRIDNDQCLRRSAKNNVKDPEAEADYYTFEAHILFDDAFELENEESSRVVMNTFVKDFLKIVNKATKNIYGTDDIWIKPPLKYSTPYGGRLEYTMPGENKLYVHLKDKDKIRHKKRWSQVMYMYYLLGFKLMEQSLPYEKKMEMAENTFLLALDGDIDFKPDAVILLVDLMKKNKGLGAACGRIHPVGAGFMVWYQYFEYAIGHWLQKATEHMIGCVLCSPGCFSLFRAKALMSPNVMKRYTTVAEEARHFVQYDQGEDRWLCTLLLQRGYRVEYSAASDAYTHCPETFQEFYTQRRRWVPSTMANILDLLNDYKRVVQINNDVSLPYIMYQMILLIGTILGPGTILLMLVGAFNAAFKIDNWTALYLNLIPIFFFMFCCLFASQKVQISTALVISLVYGLIMMAVLVGIVMEIKDDGLLSPSSLFLFITAGEIIVAAAFHPQEFGCLFSGVIYYVTIPSMYLLLIIYSVCNLNVVSWGTREVAKKKTKADLENEKKEAELAEKKAQKSTLLGIFDGLSGQQQKEKSGALELSVGNLFKCMCCTSEKNDTATTQIIKLKETLNTLSKNIERSLEGEVAQSRRFTARQSVVPNNMDETNNENLSGNPQDDFVLVKNADDPDEDDLRDELFNPYWIEAKELRRSKFEVLSSQEILFWKDLIKLYLKPIAEDKEKKKEISKNLKELRDKIVVTFFMLNALFVVVIFLLQVNKDQIHIRWPLGAKSNITFNPVTYEINIKKKYLQLEPVGLTFIAFFASILIIQFIAMLFHRFETLCHLLSNTPITFLRRNKTHSFKEKLEMAKKKFNQQNQAQIMRRDMEKENEAEDSFLRRRESFHPAEKRKSIQPDIMFDHIFQQMNEDQERETAQKEERRRSSLLPWRQNSFNRSKPSTFTNLGLDKIEEEER